MKVVALSPSHNRRSFSCGNDQLDEYLRTKASQHQRVAANQTYVGVVDDAVVGFVTVSVVTMRREQVGPERRKLPPQPLPVLLLARLGVDKASQSQGRGQTLLKHVFRLARQISAAVGCVGVFVDSKPTAVGWYQKLGFVTLGDPVGGLTPMFLSISGIPDERQEIG
ncbi:MAG: GNAT family N-acetyltransferase [Kofleriaceae bacterium]|jgi:ribosomal protein S18 acetylase RimI-like enzyme|nr:GNAT family N-acetyltransferase [Kofleriaceae bacterium]MBP9172463.1 GNAT family N-acetyltransferase [Kofleriaceae bacterium]MBP9862807.1 GNAT family N-acetyltransferase [Kofleriaceae bacterium]